MRQSRLPKKNQHKLVAGADRDQRHKKCQQRKTVRVRFVEETATLKEPLFFLKSKYIRSTRQGRTLIRKASKTSRRKQRAHRIKDQVFDQRESTSKSTWRRQAYASLRQGQPLRVITSATNLVVNQERARWRPIGLKSRHLGAV